MLPSHPWTSPRSLPAPVAPQVVPERETKLEWASVVSRPASPHGYAIVACSLKHVSSHMEVFDLDGRLISTLDLPTLCTVSGFSALPCDDEVRASPSHRAPSPGLGTLWDGGKRPPDPDRPCWGRAQAFFSVASMLLPGTVYRYDVNTDSLTVFEETKVPGYDPNEFSVRCGLRFACTPHAPPRPRALLNGSPPTVQSGVCGPSGRRAGARRRAHAEGPPTRRGWQAPAARPLHDDGLWRLWHHPAAVLQVSPAAASRLRPTPAHGVTPTRPAPPQRLPSRLRARIWGGVLRRQHSGRRRVRRRVALGAHTRGGRARSLRSPLLSPPSFLPPSSFRQAGKVHKKQNGFDDFAACGEHLISRGYTSPDRLVIIGGSNGGAVGCTPRFPSL